MSTIAATYALVWLASGVIVHQPSERICREQAQLLGDHVRCIEVRVPCCCAAAVSPVAPLVPFHQRGDVLPPVAPPTHAQPIPEPGSLALLAAAIAGLAIARRA